MLKPNLTILLLLLTHIYANPALYFQFYGSAYKTNIDFTGLSTKNGNITELSNISSYNKLQYAGPAVNEATGDLYYIIARSTSSTYELVHQDPITEVTTILYDCTFPCVFGSYSSIKRTLTWDDENDVLLIGIDNDLFTFNVGVDSEPQANVTNLSIGAFAGPMFVRGDALYMGATNGVFRYFWSTGTLETVVTGSSIKGIFVTQTEDYLYYTDMNDGVYRIPDARVNDESSAQLIEDWKACERYYGVVVNEVTGHFYTQCKTVFSLYNVPLVRGNTNGSLINRVMYDTGLDNSGGTLDSRMFMSIVQGDWTWDIPHYSRGSLRSQTELMGMVTYLQDTKSGDFFYFHVDMTTKTRTEFFRCPETLYMVSGPATDYATGLVYIICQNTLHRIDLYAMMIEGKNITDPGVHEEIVTVGVATGEGSNRIFQDRYTFGTSTIVDQDTGIFYFIGRYYTTNSAFHPVVYYMEPGVTYLPTVAFFIPEVTDYQSGKFVLKDGNLYIAVWQLGLYKINTTLPGTPDTTEKYLVMENTDEDFYGFDIDSRDGKLYYFKSVVNSFNGTHILSREWDETTGTYPADTEAEVGDIFLRGHCLTGCQLWSGLLLLVDPDTNLLWTLYRNGDGNHFINYVDLTLGVVSEECYFHLGEKGNTLAKQGDLYQYGSPSISSCPCFDTYYLPSTQELGICSPALWFDPIQIRCDTCTKNTTKPGVEGKEPRCRLSCCQSGYTDGECSSIDSGNSIGAISESTFESNIESSSTEPETSSYISTEHIDTSDTIDSTTTQSTIIHSYTETLDDTTQSDTSESDATTTENSTTQTIDETTQTDTITSEANEDTTTESIDDTTQTDTTEDISSGLTKTMSLLVLLFFLLK